MEFQQKTRKAASSYIKDKFTTDDICPQGPTVVKGMTTIVRMIGELVQNTTGIVGDG